MSQQPLIGISNRPIRVIVKAAVSPQSDSAYIIRRHSLAMLKELVAMYPKEATEYVRRAVLDKVATDVLEYK